MGYLKRIVEDEPEATIRANLEHAIALIGATGIVGTDAGLEDFGRLLLLTREGYAFPPSPVVTQSLERTLGALTGLQEEDASSRLARSNQVVSDLIKVANRLRF